MKTLIKKFIVVLCVRMWTFKKQKVHHCVFMRMKTFKKKFIAVFSFFLCFFCATKNKKDALTRQKKACIISKKKIQRVNDKKKTRVLFCEQRHFVFVQKKNHFAFCHLNLSIDKKQVTI